ncbi:MAG TPA: SH3 domain-containing C40 family peptidase [Balneolales bacterium]|nr:SH3 domain-containing C40 family peptidase [Balneolales bacterium]
MTKYLYAILLLSTFLFISCDSQHGGNKTVDQAIKKVKQEYAPDSRTAIFQVSYHIDGNKVDLRGETNLSVARDALIKKLKASNSNRDIDDNIVLLPDKNLNGDLYGVVDLSACNIRTHPHFASELSTQSTLGTVVRVYKKNKNGEWYYIQTPDKYLGWVDSGGITLMNKSQYDNWMKNPKVIYTKEYGNSYQKPDPDAQHVSDLVEGNILEDLGTAGNFVKVKYPDERIAYIPSKYVMRFSKWLSDRKPTAHNVIKTAKKFIGIPYLWGGTSPKGVDCSGFTKTAFYLNGIILPRDASQQAEVGVPVPTDTTLKNLKPGDLLFFGKKATKNHKADIVHVALYLGNGKFINSAGTVKIESLKRGDKNFNAYRLRTFVGARRLLNNIGKHGVERIQASGFYKLKSQTKM